MNYYIVTLNWYRLDISTFYLCIRGNKLKWDMAQKKLLHAIDTCNYLCLIMPHTEDGVWRVSVEVFSDQNLISHNLQDMI